MNDYDSEHQQQEELWYTVRSEGIAIDSQRLPSDVPATVCVGGPSHGQSILRLSERTLHVLHFNERDSWQAPWPGTAVSSCPESASTHRYDLKTMGMNNVRYVHGVSNPQSFRVNLYVHETLTNSTDREFINMLASSQFALRGTRRQADLAHLPWAPPLIHVTGAIFNGRMIPRKRFCIGDRFVRYDWSDIDLLAGLGVVKYWLAADPPQIVYLGETRDKLR